MEFCKYSNGISKLCFSCLDVKDDEKGYIRENTDKSKCKATDTIKIVSCLKYEEFIYKGATELKCKHCYGTFLISSGGVSC